MKSDEMQKEIERRRELQKPKMQRPLRWLRTVDCLIFSILFINFYSFLLHQDANDLDKFIFSFLGMPYLAYKTAIYIKFGSHPLPWKW